MPRPRAKRPAYRHYVPKTSPWSGSRAKTATLLFSALAQTRVVVDTVYRDSMLSDKRLRSIVTKAIGETRAQEAMLTVDPKDDPLRTKYLSAKRQTAIQPRADLVLTLDAIAAATEAVVQEMLAISRRD